MVKYITLQKSEHGSVSGYAKFDGIDSTRLYFFEKKYFRFLNDLQDVAAHQLREIFTVAATASATAWGLLRSSLVILGKTDCLASYFFRKPTRTTKHVDACL